MEILEKKEDLLRKVSYFCSPKKHKDPMYMKRSQIGSVIRKKRRNLGLTIDNLAEISGVSDVTISSLERGGMCSMNTLVSLCDRLGLEVSIRDKKSETPRVIHTSNVEKMLDEAMSHQCEIGTYTISLFKSVRCQSEKERYLATIHLHAYEEYKKKFRGENFENILKDVNEYIESIINGDIVLESKHTEKE